MAEKTCFKCGELKSLDSFYKHAQMKDGHVNKCKECNKKDVSENYHANREHYAKYEKERFKRPERKANAIKYQRERRVRNPDVAKAYRMVNYHIRTGNLAKTPCEICGDENVEAHHEDYSKPLNVNWLCRKHHLERHDKIAYDFEYDIEETELGDKHEHDISCNPSF